MRSFGTAQQRRQTHREREQADAQWRAALSGAGLDVAERHLLAMRERGDTEGWAAGMMYAAGIRCVELGVGIGMSVLKVVPA